MLKNEAHLNSMYYDPTTEQLKYHNLQLDKIISKLKSLHIYHFHDTGKSALIKSPQPAYDVQFFKADGSNLAPFLFHLKKAYPKHFFRIEQTVKKDCPFY